VRLTKRKKSLRKEVTEEDLQEEAPIVQQSQQLIELGVFVENTKEEDLREELQLSQPQGVLKKKETHLHTQLFQNMHHMHLVNSNLL
jgi:hypothetical protein